MSKDVKRLFDEFQPEHYALQLTPDKKAKKFKGTVTVRGKKSGRPSQRLTFHQKELKVTGASIMKHDKKGDVEVSVVRVNTQDSYDEVRIHTESMVYPGDYTVTLEFSGKITKAMNGIYPCFFEEDGKKQELIATQFESHHAREVFPCIDEPEAKATFDLTLTTPKGETTLANTPIKHQQVSGSDVITEFETTPKMSTYLLAFVYGNLGFKEAKTKDGVVVRTYATPANVAFTDFALDVAVKTLEFYNDYFALPYPLPKCDMVALPDFAAGAMENWGLITYREQCMLVDPDNTSLSVRQYVAMVVAHELAHQWFGNLVTMRWWTDLWLNEGFASWIEYLAVDNLFPEWEMWTQFAVDEQQRAFKLDSLDNTHPVEVPVHHPDEIRTIFDTISYSKGASVIHMLNDYLGADMFRDGLRHYLDKNKYGNTDTVDLWAALEEVSGKPVKEFMHAWTSQSGYPLLTANVEGNTVSLTQQRFYVNPEQTKKASTTWPIALLSGSQQLPEVTGQKEAKFDIDGDATSLKLNRGQSGFYRTVYNSEHLAKLGELISSNQLTPLDRLGILSDLFEAAKAGRAKTTDALEFLRYFEDESNSAVWDVISAGIVSTRGIMDDEDLREDMKPYIRKLVNKQLTRLGWEKKEGESHFDQLLRPLVLSMASHAEEPSIVGEALRRYEAMKKPEDVDPDLRGVVYGTAVRHGDKKTFDKLFKMHEASTNSEERITIAASLTGFKQKELIEKALHLIKSDSVRHQDVGYWVAYCFTNRHGKRLTWQWLMKEWDWLEENLGSDLSFYRFPVYAANAFSERKFLDEYKKFFEPKLAPAMERSIKQGVEILTWQSAWKERDLEDIKAFFKQRAIPGSQ